MLFNIELEKKDRIVGYIVPDDYSSVATYRVVVDGREAVRKQTDEPRQALVDAKRHATGLCGFTMDARVVPDIARAAAIEIHEVEHDLLIYRRTATPTVNLRLFRLETHLLPLHALDQAIEHRFRASYLRIERLGRETTDQIFHLKHAPSLLATGRIFVKTIEHLLDTAKTAVLIRNPHYELAERLIVLQHLATAKGDLFGMRDNLLFRPAIEFAAEIDLADDKAIKTAIRRIPHQAASVLSDPITRLLAGRSADEPLVGGGVSAALDTLASCAVVGLRSQPDLFLEAIADMLEVPVDSLPAIDEYASVVDLGERLSRIPAASSLLEQDLELYHHVTTAFKKAY